MKTRLTVVVVLILLIALLSTALAQRKIELRVWTMLTVQPQVDAMNKAIEEFTKLHPNVKITLETVPYGVVYPRLMTAIQSQKLPNVFNNIEAMVAFMQAKEVLVPLDDVLAKLGRERFISKLLDLVTRDRKVWAIPDWCLHTEVWYRKDLVAQKGLTHLIPPKSWSELLQLAESLNTDSNNDGKIDIYGMAVPLDRFMVADQTYAEFAYPAGVFIFDPKSKEYVFDKYLETAAKTMQFITELYQKSSPSASINWSWADYRNAFAEGRVAMAVEWGAVVGIMQEQNPALLDKVSVFPIPGPDSENYPPKAYLGGGYFYAVSKDTPEKVAISKEFVKFLMQPDRAIAKINTRPIFALPGTYDGFRHPDFLNHPMVKKYKAELDTIQNVVLPRIQRLGLEAGLNPISGQIEGSALFGDAIQKVATGRWTTEEAVKWINDQLVMMRAFIEK